MSKLLYQQKTANLFKLSQNNVNLIYAQQTTIGCWINRTRCLMMSLSLKSSATNTKPRTTIKN